jgi:alpha-D-ribose 1-methylphosphonate 5-triphosphate synthase subunit PhnG
MKKFIKIASLFSSFLFLTSCLTTVEMSRVRHSSHEGIYDTGVRRNVVQWVYHKDGYAHCYVDGELKPKYRCAAIPRPPKRSKHHSTRWVYHNDGFAHCYVDGRLAKKSKCAAIPRPPHKGRMS